MYDMRCESTRKVDRVTESQMDRQPCVFKHTNCSRQGQTSPLKRNQAGHRGGQHSGAVFFHREIDCLRISNFHRAAGGVPK